MPGNHSADTDGSRPSRSMFLIGEYLKMKGIIDTQTLEQAIAIQQEEAKHKGAQRRRIGEILVQDLGVDRHRVYQGLSELYGFREMTLEPKTLGTECLDGIRELLSRLSQEMRADMVHTRVIPFEEGMDGNGGLKIVAADPTDRAAKALALRLGYPRFEVAYVRHEVLDELIDRIGLPIDSAGIAS